MKGSYRLFCGISGRLVLTWVFTGTLFFGSYYIAVKPKKYILFLPEVTEPPSWWSPDFRCDFGPWWGYNWVIVSGVSRRP